MNKLFPALIGLLLAGPAFADSTINNLGAGSAVSDTDNFPAYQGANPATKVTGSQLKTYVNTSAVDARTTTSEAIANSDQNKLVTFSNGSAVACTIAQAGSGGNFPAGWAVSLRNLGAGTVTCTATTSFIDTGGNFTVVLTTGQGVDLYSDGTNYFTQPGKAGGGGTVTTTGSPANGNLSQFSGATSITNGDLSGDCITAGALATTCTEPEPTAGYKTTIGFYVPKYGIAQVGTQPSGSSANTIYCAYGYVSKKVTINNLITAQGTAVVGQNVKAAIYSNVNSRPGSLIASTGSQSLASAGTYTVALVANKQVGPGGADGDRDLWWCTNIDGGTPHFVSAVNNASSFGQLTMIGASSAANLFDRFLSSATAGISCAGANCNGGTSSFASAWPASLAGSTFTEETSPVPIWGFQAASVP